MKYKIGIIILNWNGPEDTLECIKSLKKIKRRNFKIFLIDNGSSDDSLKLFSREKSKNLEIINNRINLGFDLANNLVTKNLLDQGFEYILFLNNDVVVDKKFLDYLVEFLEKNEDVSVVAPKIYDYYHTSELNSANVPGKFNLKVGGGSPFFSSLAEFKNQSIPFEVDYVSGCCFMVKNKMLKKVGLFNKNFFAYGEEIDFALRAKKRGYKFYVIPNSKIWHKGSASSNKISGFKLYYSTRNMIWTERIHSSRIDFVYFILNFIIKKIPKNIYKIICSENKLSNFRKFLNAIADGFFGRRSEFDNESLYQLV
jgi:GT2 family glycosyltransferase